MTPGRDEPWLDLWFADGPAEVADRVIEGALTTIDSTPQRHARVPWRISNMNASFRVVAVAAAALAIIFGPLNLLPHGSTGPGVNVNVSPSPAPLPPTDCPAGTPLPSGSIATIAGTGDAGPTGDGVLALNATLSVGQGIAVDTAGNVYFGDAKAHAVRRIRPDGIIEAYATGLDAPSGLAFDAAGNLYLTDNFVRIKKIDPAGTVTTVAGTGVSGSSGNDGPAMDAQIQAAGLAIGPRGDLYFDDLNNYRTIDPQGVIHAFAGSVTPGFSGDGGLAVNATFGESVNGMGPDSLGNVYLGDPGNLRIRRVDTAGVIMTVAGTGTSGYSGDNGPAIDATMMPSPYGMAVDPAGDLYFTDWQTASVRRIDPAGIITTVAGTGGGGSAGDCGPATAAYLNGPVAVAVHQGALFIADSQNNKIRMVVP